MCENDSVGAKWCGVYLNRGCRPTSPVSLVNPPRDTSCPIHMLGLRLLRVGVGGLRGRIYSAARRPSCDIKSTGEQVH